MRSNHFEVMQSYKPVNAAFMQNIAFFYSAGSNEITKVFQLAVCDLQRHQNKTLLGGLIKAEHVHHSLFSIRGKSKLTLTHFSSTAYSPFLLLHPPQYCHGFGHHLAFSQSGGEKGAQGFACWAAKAGISFWRGSCFGWKNLEEVFLIFFF